MKILKCNDCIWCEIAARRNGLVCEWKYRNVPTPLRHDMTNEPQTVTWPSAAETCPQYKEIGE